MEEKINRFWKWFAEKEAVIIQLSQLDGAAVVHAIDKELSPVFDYYGGEIEFEFGFNDGKGELVFFDCGDEQLHRDGLLMGELMPDVLKERWSFEVLN